MFEYFLPFFLTEILADIKQMFKHLMPKKFPSVSCKSLSISARDILDSID